MRRVSRRLRHGRCFRLHRHCHCSIAFTSDVSVPRIKERGWPRAGGDVEGVSGGRQESKVLDYQLDRRSQDDRERSLDGVSPALWCLGRIESGRSRAAVYRPGVHVVLFQADYGPDVGSSRSSAADRPWSRDMCRNLCLYPARVDVSCLALAVWLGLDSAKRSSLLLPPRWLRTVPSSRRWAPVWGCRGRSWISGTLAAPCWPAC